MVRAIEDIQADLFAEDVPIPAEASTWNEEQIVAYFESGGDMQAAIKLASTHTTNSKASQSALAALTTRPIQRYMAAVGCEVVTDVAIPRELPEPGAKALGAPHDKGAVLLAGAHFEGWLQLAPDYCSPADVSGWFCCTGEEADVRLSYRSLPEGTAYKMTRTGKLSSYAAPGGLGEATVHSEVHQGSMVSVDVRCGHWVRLCDIFPSAWVELDNFLLG